MFNQKYKLRIAELEQQLAALKAENKQTAAEYEQRLAEQKNAIPVEKTANSDKTLSNILRSQAALDDIRQQVGQASTQMMSKNKEFAHSVQLAETVEGQTTKITHALTNIESIASASSLYRLTKRRLFMAATSFR